MRDRPGGEQALEQRAVGVAAVLGRVRAEPGGGEERPLEVGAEDARPGPAPPAIDASAPAISSSAAVITVGR